MTKENPFREIAEKRSPTHARMLANAFLSCDDRNPTYAELHAVLSFAKRSFGVHLHSYLTVDFLGFFSNPAGPLPDEIAKLRTLAREYLTP